MRIRSGRSNGTKPKRGLVLAVESWRVAICSRWLPYRALRLPLYSPSPVNSANVSPTHPCFSNPAHTIHPSYSIISCHTPFLPHKTTCSAQPINAKATSSTYLSAGHYHPNSVLFAKIDHVRVRFL